MRSFCPSLQAIGLWKTGKIFRVDGDGQYAKGDITNGSFAVSIDSGLPVHLFVEADDSVFSVMVFESSKSRARVEQPRVQFPRSTARLAWVRSPMWAHWTERSWHIVRSYPM